MERFNIHSDICIVFTNSSYFSVKKGSNLEIIIHYYLWAMLLVISTQDQPEKL